MIATFYLVILLGGSGRSPTAIPMQTEKLCEQAKAELKENTRIYGEVVCLRASE